jgi:hypothetical protein
MKEFLKEMRAQSDKNYETLKPFFDERIKREIKESAERGSRTISINLQCHKEVFERYIKELGLECIGKSYNYSWANYIIQW